MSVLKRRLEPGKELAMWAQKYTVMTPEPPILVHLQTQHRAALLILQVAQFHIQKAKLHILPAPSQYLISLEFLPYLHHQREGPRGQRWSSWQT